MENILFTPLNYGIILTDMKNLNFSLILEEKSPALDYTPVYYQPPLKKLKASNLDVKPLIKWAKICRDRNDIEEFTKVYNQLLQEYKPLIDWAFLCWDYLVTTQGFRYLPRKGTDRYFCHGDYKPFDQREYKKLLNKCFKNLFLKYQPNGNFTGYLRKKYWNMVIQEYNELRKPKSEKERLLTDFSYLRCVPYRFFNRHHQDRVNETLNILQPLEKKIIYLYFFKFYTHQAICGEINLDVWKMTVVKERALKKIYNKDKISYALLKQIERY
ncbi:MAG TPA: sigma-70 family RNA polymerase sigma factor [Candidatus Omnitrophica bacterium]|nr:sigma-70 family RNA polymerase sigma factor [Candidatus Omnitrophota bacterium]